jgi:biopolymer transport protein ExbB
MMSLRRTRICLVCVILLGLAWSSGFLIPSAFGQFGGGEKKDEADAPAAEEKPPAEAAPAADPAAPPAEKVEAKSGGTDYWWYIYNSGFIGLIILVLSIYFVSTIIRLFLEMRPVVAMPPDLLDECEDLLTKRQFKDIFALVKEDDSAWGRIVSTGIAELPNGLSEAREAADRVAEVITVENERKISMLAVIGSLGPMIGLLGTLKGMIGSFAVIAQTDQQIKANEVASHLSEALLLTFEGVALALPAIYFFAVFRGRVAYLGVTTLLSADEFIRRFAHAARGKAATPSSTAAPPAPAPAPAKPVTK